MRRILSAVTGLGRTRRPARPAALPAAFPAAADRRAAPLPATRRPATALVAALSAILLAALIEVPPAVAGEQPAGEPIERHGMEIAGIFLQAVKMEPATPGQEADAADIHLEADIVALPGNENGFAAGAWVPYLTVDYTLTRKGSDWTKSGTLIPMVASDGPHYGANVALDGPGEYHVTFRIAPPSSNGFLRHYDKETGVGRWWEPFTYDGDFIFAGAGKKGGY